jgi:hypothetical protein
MTPKQLFIAEFRETCSHLSLSKSTINSLAMFAANADDVTVSALRQLLAQPDPNGSLAAALPSKVRDVRSSVPDYFEPFKDIDGLTHWIKSANFCFHAVDEIITQNWTGNKPRRDDHLASCFVEGVWHYRTQVYGYSNEQARRFTLIAAAAYCAERKASVEQGESSSAETINAPECTDYFDHDHYRCKSLGSPTIKALAAGSQDAAEAILSIILDKTACTEAEILYYLDGGHSALVDGAI